MSLFLEFNVVGDTRVYSEWNVKSSKINVNKRAVAQLSRKIIMLPTHSSVMTL